MIKIAQRAFLVLLFSVITFTLILHLGQVYSFWNIDKKTFLLSRWFALTFMVWYALRKKSLTTWILISMVLGAEFGYDAPSVAIHLNL